MCQEVNAKSLSAISVRQIGHSEQASEQDLHTAKKSTIEVILEKGNGERKEGTCGGSNHLRQKCRQGRRIAAVGDSKHTLQMWEFTSPFPRYLSSFSFISCIRA